jgi:hypothetical protein
MLMELLISVSCVNWFGTNALDGVAMYSYRSKDANSRPFCTSHGVYSPNHVDIKGQLACLIENVV